MPTSQRLRNPRVLSLHLTRAPHQHPEAKVSPPLARPVSNFAESARWPLPVSDFPFSPRSRFILRSARLPLLRGMYGTGTGTDRHPVFWAFTVFETDPGDPPAKDRETRDGWWNFLSLKSRHWEKLGCVLVPLSSCSRPYFVFPPLFRFIGELHHRSIPTHHPSSSVDPSRRHVIPKPGGERGSRAKRS